MKSPRQTQSSPSTARPLVGELERLGPNGRDVLVLGVEVPGFNELPTDRKLFAYYMYRAAIAGNNIMFAQNHRHALEIKNLLEGILACSSDIPDKLRDAVHDYLKYFWIHHGNYHHYTHTKYVPNSLTAGGLHDAAKIAAKNGAAFELADGETLATKIARLGKTIFDLGHETLQSNQNPNDDIVQTSAANFWDADVTQAEIDALPDSVKNKINMHFTRRNGEVVAEPYRIGGVFGRELETIVFFLELALPLAEDNAQRTSLEHLIEFYQGGDEEAFREHCIHWLKSDATVDYVNGFIEQYIDPRGVAANFEGNVSIAADAELVDAIANEALYFEKRMPWPDVYKRSTVDPPVAKVVNVLVETGDAGPVSPAAYNLPNYNDIRRDHGSKNVMLLNVERTSSQELLKKSVNEFYLPEYRDSVIKYALSKIRPLTVYLHEIVGHGSGQTDSKLLQDPRTLLGRAYSPLEECRADCVALYHLSDPRMVEIGAFTAEEQATIVETAYIMYTQGWLTRLDQVDGYEVREAHAKGHHLILMYLLENGGDAAKDFGLRIVENDGDYFVEMTDPEKVRNGITDLLTKLQIMKSTADVDGTRALFQQFGTHVDPAWKQNVTERLERLNTPRLKAFVFPHLTPRLQDGEIVDIDIACDEDLTAQQLRFSRLQYVQDATVD